MSFFRRIRWMHFFSCLHIEERTIYDQAGYYKQDGKWMEDYIRSLPYSDLA